MEAVVAQSVWKRGTGCSVQGQKILLFSIASKPVLETTQPPIQWVPWAVSPGVKWPQLEDGQSPVSSARVKNGGAMHELPCTSSCSGAELMKHRDNFAFT
jgi:hypothetical protein